MFRILKQASNNIHIIGIETQLFKEGDSLMDFIKKYISSLGEGDILAVTSKIVALSERRTAPIKNKNRLIRKESKKVIETPWGYVTQNKDGWNINAGIDESNAKNKLILLPKGSFQTAELLLKKVKKYYSLKKAGILITDTRSVPLRVGTIGRALGYAGFIPIKNYINKKDLFGRKSRVTKSNHADALAAAAVLMMGEGNEQTPLVVIKNAPVIFISKPLSKKMKQLNFPAEKDIFSKVFTSTIEQTSREFPKKKLRG